MQKCGRSKSKTFTVVILYYFDCNKAHLELETTASKL